MEKVVVVKYGELTTKKGNRNQFINILKRNVKEKLEGLDYKLTANKVRMFIESSDNDEVVRRLGEVFGIHDLVVAYKVVADYDVIAGASKKIFDEISFKTFKVNTNRANKSFPMNSMEVSRNIGGVILEHKDISVDVKNPEVVLNIEIRDKFAYLSTNQNRGIGGYPVGVQGKGLLMLSGGIDSPVAGYLASKRGIALEAIYFEAIPHTSLKARQKVIDLANILKKYNHRIKIHVIPFTEIQETIYKEIDNRYLITIMRRMMYQISERLADQINAKILVNGESIGQVASQTLDSIRAINEVIKIPVLRPVACLDKEEIIVLAKKIGTYETSILPYEDCCTVFVPKHPAIKPKASICKEYEAGIDFDTMMSRAIDNRLIIEIGNNEKSDLL